MTTPPPTSTRGVHARPAGVALVFGAIGIVFGDIGTSPLYTFQECVSDRLGAPASDPANVMAVTSLIVWSVTLVVTIKYLLFLMRADNRGEGGIMALLALVPSRIRAPGPGRVGAVALLVVIGASLLFGDGIITPAISVLSAVEGLGVATDELKPAIVPITIAILVALFAVQRRGTGRLGKYFGPIMVVWFVTIGVLGATHIAKTPAILGALSPHHGVTFFAAHGWKGMKVLGGVVLAVTGGEALYADMGHFGARPIRVAWLLLVYPALLLCYMGQGANLLAHPELASQPFYALVGDDKLLVYPMVLLATLATVIASQALISGVFSLTHQGISLGFFPRIEVRHTSEEAEGQIYVPLLNTGLALSCIALVVVFRESSKLASAFGLAVSGTMLITALVYYVVTRSTFRWPLWACLAVLFFFLSFDIPFVVANAIKFMDGGYLPFAVGVVFTVVMVSWRIGRSLLADVLSKTPALEDFVAGISKATDRRLPGTAVVMSSLATGTPPALTRMVTRFRVAHEHTFVLTLSTAHVPVVAESERIELTDLGEGFHRLVVSYGFMEEPNVPRIVAHALEKAKRGIDVKDVVYLLGRETLLVSPHGRMDRITEPIFAFLSRNARSAAMYFGIPPEQVVEIGTQIDL